MVMEYVDGCSLAEYLKAYKAPLPLEIALFITIRVLDALNYAHQKKTKKDKPKALSIAIYHLKISLRPYQEQ
jgi:serine/threonine protein kinase